MSPVEVSVEVAAPLTVAYDHFADFGRFPDFMEGVEDLVQIDETHVHWRTTTLGVVQEFDTEILEQRPGDRIGWRATAGAGGHSGCVQFTALDAGHTRLVLRLEFDEDQPLDDDVVRFHHRRVAADLERFREMIERSDRAEPAV